MSDSYFDAQEEGNKSVLQAMLMADDITPGTDPSYELCKIIYAYHPLGLKMVDTPIMLAMSQEREVTGIPELAKKQFNDTWSNSGVNDNIAGTVRLSRIYGLASCAEVASGVFSVFDPLNTAGSVVLNQEPTAVDFMKPTGVEVQGKEFPLGKSVVVQNGPALYIQYTNSSFGFNGRSVYQNTLFLLKTYLQSMLTDNMVAYKAGVLIAKTENGGSQADGIKGMFQAIKRRFLKKSETNSVLSIGVNDTVETLNMQNTADAMTVSKDSTLDNIAAGCNMPAVLLKSEIMTHGFGEGTQDAISIAHYVEHFRKQMEPLYQYFIPRIQRAAWTEEWYEAFVAENEEYVGVSFKVAINRWTDTFESKFPSLLVEPDSEKIKKQEASIKNALDFFDKLQASLGPSGRKGLVEWLIATVNSEGMDLLFPEPLVLELDDTDFAIAKPTEVKEEERDEEGDTSDSDNEDMNDSVNYENPKGRALYKTTDIKDMILADKITRMKPLKK